jgi:hypothetical protein
MAKIFNHIPVVLFTLIIVSCSNSPADELEHLNGYWEIAQIENSYGSKKEYSISQNIEFFEITKEGKGVRKKVQPDINGNFTTTNSSQNIDIEINDGDVFLNYSTEFDLWREEILSISPSTLILKNEDAYIYTYRRYQPLAIN